MRLALPLAILSALCALACFWRLTEGAYIQALSLHFAGGGCGFGAAAVLRIRGNYHRLNAALALLIPVLGGVVCAVCALGSAGGGRSGIATEYLRHIDPEEYRQLFASADTDFKPNPDRLEPLADILHSGAGIAQKRVAIEALAQMECPESVAILREALRMDSVEVRFFAASVLGRLEDNLAGRLREVHKDKHSHDPGNMQEGAQACFDNAFYGIAEGTRRQNSLALALEKVEKILAQQQLPAAVSLKGRILMECGQHAQALETFALYRKLRPGDAAGIIWQAEAEYRAGNYQAGIIRCREARETGILPRKIAPAVCHWAGGGANERTI